MVRERRWLTAHASPGKSARPGLPTPPSPAIAPRPPPPGPARPGRHGDGDEGERRFGRSAELELRAERNGRRDAGADGDDLLAFAGAPPQLATPGDEIPDLFHRAMDDGVRTGPPAARNGRSCRPRARRAAAPPSRPARRRRARRREIWFRTRAWQSSRRLSVSVTRLRRRQSACHRAEVRGARRRRSPTPEPLANRSSIGEQTPGRPYL